MLTLILPSCSCWAIDNDNHFEQEQMLQASLHGAFTAGNISDDKCWRYFVSSFAPTRRDSPEIWRSIYVHTLVNARLSVNFAESVSLQSPITTLTW